MFQYLAITQPTANWLLTNKMALHDIAAHLADFSSLDQLRTSALLAGPLRFAASPGGIVLCLWNINYLTGTGSESWGFLRLSSPNGLLDQPSIMQEALERSVTIVNMRLQGLLLEGVIHRTIGDTIHSCVAGRGDDARQLSLYYSEERFAAAETMVHTLVCVGPGRNRDSLEAAATDASLRLVQLNTEAHGVLAALVRRPTLGATGFAHLAARDWARELESTPPPSVIEPVPHLTLADRYEGVQYSYADWTYDQWTDHESPLTQSQRRILERDVLLKQPLRIAGAAGSGKTLLMQLLAIRRLRAAKSRAVPLRVLYVVHSTAMMNTVWSKFVTLGADEFLTESGDQRLEVSTLFSRSQSELNLNSSAVIDPDAQETKAFQLTWIRTAIEAELGAHELDSIAFPLLSQVKANDNLMSIFADVVAAEIAVAIKGHGLTDNKKRYVGSETPLSRLHGALNERERALLFDIFLRYHRDVFETQGMLDSDDVALSLLGQLRTPLWSMKRRSVGYDFVFVDETQLFNENERRALPLLTRGDKSYVPVVLALDEAQELRGNVSAGFGLLGIEQIWDASLATIHRSTAGIIQLAFFVIQQTTDLFGPDFPDFTASTVSVIPDDHKLASKPAIAITSAESRSMGRAVLRQVRALRRGNMRQVGVIVHSDKYWEDVVQELRREESSIQVLTQRGTRVDPDRPVIVVAKPATVGGQEFDAVLAVGLEQGLVPPRVEGHYGLAMSLEQQALREMYLSFTRAKYQLIILLPPDAAPTRIIHAAIESGLLDKKNVAGS